jgi:hypothetical protein
MELNEVGCEDAECNQLAHEKVTYNNEPLVSKRHKYFVKISSLLFASVR